MSAQRKYPDELRERAVKVVFEIRELDGKGHGEISRVARQLDVHPEAPRPACSRRKLTVESVPARRLMISSGSLNWSVRDASSGG